MNIFTILTMVWLAIGTVLVSQSSLEVEGNPPTFLKMIAIAVAIIVAPMVALEAIVNHR